MDDIQIPIITYGNKGTSRPIGMKRPAESEPEVPPKHVKEGKAQDLIAVIEPQIIKIKNSVQNKPIPVPVVTKPAKKRFITIKPNMTAKDIIEGDIRFGNKVSPEARIGILRKALELIAENNYDELKAYEETFKTEFKRRLTTYSRNGIENYLMLFVILFGNYKLADLVKNTTNFFQQNFELLPDILRYLFQNQSLESCLSTTFKFCENVIYPETRAELIIIANKRFPNMDYFERLLLNLMGAINSDGLLTILTKRSDYEKAKVLANFGLIIPNEYLIHFQQFPLERPDIFLSRHLSEDDRYYFLIAIFRDDNVEILPKVLEIHPELIVHNLMMEENFSNSTGLKNVFQLTAEFGAYKCFEFLSDLMPEMLSGEMEEISCPIKQAILSQKNTIKFLEVLEARGITYETSLKASHKSHQSLSALQYAFEREKSEAFNYFYDKAGVSNAKSHIHTLYKDNINELVTKLFLKFDDYVTKKVVTDFGIDLNAKNYEYNCLRGNASIFFNFWDMRERVKFFNINVDLSPQYGYSLFHY